MSDKIDLTEMSEEELEEFFRQKNRNESKWGSKIGNSL